MSNVMAFSNLSFFAVCLYKYILYILNIIINHVSSVYTNIFCSNNLVPLFILYSFNSFLWDITEKFSARPRWIIKYMKRTSILAHSLLSSKHLINRFSFFNTYKKSLIFGHWNTKLLQWNISSLSTTLKIWKQETDGVRYGELGGWSMHSKYFMSLPPLWAFVLCPTKKQKNKKLISVVSFGVFLSTPPFIGTESSE